VIKKTEPIYEIIHEPSITSRQLKEELPGKDMIPEVRKDMMDWAQKKTLEINHLKQMAKYRREFLGNISHELKTPIFNIQGYILTLLEGGLEDTKINKLYLQRAEKSINRMISIVNDMESISKLESGVFKLEFERFNIVKLVAEIFENIEISAKKGNITLSLKQKASEKEIWVWADKKRIFEVLSNLITNSINYGKKHGKTIVSFGSSGKNVIIRVTDNGAGIPEKDLPRIFERFYRVDRSRSRNLGGTGLGLAIVKHIIEAHKSTIKVKSKLKKGSEFSFTLKKV
jgi:two-component system phosphate regulon sensor histidine kinase PhoR